MCVQSHLNEVQKLSSLGQKFALIYASWIAYKDSCHIWDAIAISHTGKPVMVVELARFDKEEREAKYLQWHSLGLI